MRTKTVLFDFDGTIADTFLLVVDIFYKLRPRPIIFSKKDVDKLRGMALLEVTRELDVKWWQVPMLLIKGRRMMAHEMRNVNVIRGMDTLIRLLHKKGYHLYIVSSNSESNIRQLLRRYDLEKCFEEVHGGSRLHGKTRIISRLAKESGAALTDTYYIGDEVRDIVGAKRAGAKSIAVTWGYNNVHILKTHQPFALAFDPDEIADIILKDRS